jgi:hypothetical protein
MRTHRYALGQHVSYAEDYAPNDIWRGGYDIVFLLPAGDREPQYQIRSAPVAGGSRCGDDAAERSCHTISDVLGNSAKPEF